MRSSLLLTLGVFACLLSLPVLAGEPEEPQKPLRNVTVSMDPDGIDVEAGEKARMEGIAVVAPFVETTCKGGPFV